MIKPTFAYVISNVLLFFANINDLDLLLKLLTFFAYMVFMTIAITEKISAVKKGKYLNEYNGSWKYFIIETIKDFAKNIGNGK